MSKDHHDLAPASSENWTKLTEKDAFKALENIKGQLFINNEWVASKAGGVMEVVDPRTGNTIKEVAKAGTDDVDAAVKAARLAFDEGPWPKMGGKVGCEWWQEVTVTSCLSLPEARAWR